MQEKIEPQDLVRIIRQPDGRVLALPSTSPLPPEARQALQEWRHLNGNPVTGDPIGREDRLRNAANIFKGYTGFDPEQVEKAIIEAEQR